MAGRKRSKRQTQIINRLKSLRDIPGVTVEESEEGGTIRIDYPTEHSLGFKLVWLDKHYIGYFTDNEGKDSQAVISLWKSLDAIYFATAYSLLIELRAKRKGYL